MRLVNRGPARWLAAVGFLAGVFAFGAGSASATTTANVAVTDGPATDAAGHVIVRGIAQDAAGAPLPLGQLEQRMVNAGGFTGTQHRRDARAPGDGTLSYDAPGSIHWTATYAFS